MNHPQFGTTARRAADEDVALRSVALEGNSAIPSWPAQATDDVVGDRLCGLHGQRIVETVRVDRSTITRIREVAKQGALAALAASKPGVASRARDYELEAAKAEVARLSEALKEMAVRLTLVEGKGGWD